MTWPFENDTSVSIRKIASSKLKNDKLKKRISIFAIALATMLMSLVLLLVSGIAVVNKNGGNSVTGSYHALVPGVSQQEFERLRLEEQSLLTGLTVSMGSSKTGDGRLNISYSNADALILNGLSVPEGRMPESENEILIEKDYLDDRKLDAGIGDTISIVMPGMQVETEFTISGYLETAASGTGRSLYAAVISEQYFTSRGGWEAFSPSAMIRVDTSAASSKTEIEKLVMEVIGHAGIKKAPSINEAYINLSKPSVFLIGTAAAGLAVIVMAGILVIYCIFYIAIMNSIQEYGQLRTLGMTGRQIKRLVFREGFTLSVKSIPIGLAAGTMVPYLLLPQGFQFASLLWAWPIVVVLVYITVRLSIRKPARIAASVSPIEASRYMGQQNGRGRKTSGTKRISPVMLAKKHISTNRKKNALTVMSLVLTGVLLIGLSSVLSPINAREMSLSGFPRGQFIITMSDQRLRNTPLEQVQAVSPFTDNLQHSLSLVSGLEAITEYHYLPAAFTSQAAESEIAAVSFERSDMDLIRSCQAGQTALEYDELTDKDFIIIGRPEALERDYGIRAEAGQTLTLKIFDGTASKRKDFTVAAVLDESKIGNNGDKIDMLMLPKDAMDKLVSCNTMYQLTLRVSDDMEAQAEAEIEQILDEAAGFRVQTLSAAISQNENFIQGMKLVLSVAIAFIGCFSIMNLVNTILTGVITRQKEFALMRSVGMSKNQLSAMVRCESLITSGIGLFVSLLAGGGVGGILCSVLKNGLMSYLHYRFPLGISLLYCAIVILSAITVAWAALKYSHKLTRCTS